MSALQCFRLSGQQGQSLSELYTALGQRGVGAGLPFPSVVVLAPKSISNLEKMVSKERVKAGGKDGKERREIRLCGNLQKVMNGQQVGERTWLCQGAAPPLRDIYGREVGKAHMNGVTL